MASLETCFLAELASSYSLVPRLASGRRQRPVDAAPWSIDPTQKPPRDADRLGAKSKQSCPKANPSAEETKASPLHANGRCLGGMKGAQPAKRSPGVAQKSPDQAKQPPDEAMTSPHAAKKSLHAAKESFHAAKESLHAAKESFHAAKESPPRSQEVPRRDKGVTPCGQESHLTRPRSYSMRHESHSMRHRSHSMRHRRSLHAPQESLHAPQESLHAPQESLNSLDESPDFAPLSLHDPNGVPRARATTTSWPRESHHRAKKATRWHNLSPLVPEGVPQGGCLASLNADGVPPRATFGTRWVANGTHRPREGTSCANPVPARRLLAHPCARESHRCPDEVTPLGCRCAKARHQEVEVCHLARSKATEGVVPGTPKARFEAAHAVRRGLEGQRWPPTSLDGECSRPAPPAGTPWRRDCQRRRWSRNRSPRFGGRWTCHPSHWSRPRSFRPRSSQGRCRCCLRPRLSSLQRIQRRGWSSFPRWSHLPSCQWS